MLPMVTNKTDEEKQAFSNRMNEALDDMGIAKKGQNRQSIVGEMFGVSQKGARKWLEGESMPSIPNAAIIARKLGVSFEWLMTGRGAKTASKRLSKDAQFIGEVYDMMDKDLRREISSYMAYVIDRVNDSSIREKIKKSKAKVIQLKAD